MNSQVVNKLIRSEIWPLLRDQGFSKFEARTAFRYHGPFIDVVSFQSFNSYLAEGIGCTTFSFTLRVGLYVIGSAREDRLKRDSSGLLLPRENACSFRQVLNKRGPIDGFDRDDVFYMDAEGRTAAACINEVRHLLTEVAPNWFERFDDLDGLIAFMERENDSSSGGSSGEHVFFEPQRGSYFWHDVLSTLLLTKHSLSPAPQSAEAAVGAIAKVIGLMLNFSIVLATPASMEAEVLRIRGLWERLGAFAPVPVDGCPALSSWRPLTDSVWAAPSTCLAGANDIDRGARFQDSLIRQHMWPVLRRHGFTEFTQRLAHRVAPDWIETVEVVPVDPAERRARGLKEGLFRVGVGIYWPSLHGDGSVRVNRAAEPRPKVAGCHLSNWLVPERRTCAAARSAFDSIENACQLLPAALCWLGAFRDVESGLSILRKDDWELFWRLPMMRGCGAKASTRRLIFLAHLASQLGRNEEAHTYLHSAEAAVDAIWPERARPRYLQWIEVVRARLAAPCAVVQPS